MKVWITKYALTRGIIEVESIQLGNRNYIMPDLGIYYVELDKENIEWASSKEKAIEVAEKMKHEQAVYLKNQNDILEKLRFE